MEKKRPEKFRGRYFPVGIIVLCVRWYPRYCLSYRDLEEMMAERGVDLGAHPYWGQHLLRLTAMMIMRFSS